MRAFFAKWRFVRGYAGELKKSGSHGDAVRAGFTRLSEKPPFDVLTDADIKRLAPVVSLIPDVQGVLAFVINIVRQNDATPLKNKGFLDALRKKYVQINRQQGTRGKRT